MERRIKEFLEERKKEDLLRSLTRATKLPRIKVLIDGKEYVNFSSNDYLGFSTHPAIASAVKGAVSFGTGSSASRLMTGSLDLHHALEEKVAHFKGKEDGAVFNSGYQANVGIISALCGKDDCVFSDRLNHASIVDGIKLSGASHIRFRHNDAGHLEELLEEKRKDFRNSLIVTETVFSMDGDIAPLEDVVRLKKKYDSLLMVDEAHATGLFGPSGSGITEEKALSGEIDIIMGTFSKALGVFGAYAATSKVIKDFLVNSCRSFIYSTSLPEAIMAANLVAIEIVGKEPNRRKLLLENAEYFRSKVKSLGFDTRGESQIVPIVLGDNEKVLKFSSSLRKKGWWVTPVRPPTVPKGEARLRMSLTFDHSKSDLDRLISDMSCIK